MVKTVAQIPALFQPKRGADEKHPIVKTPTPKNKPKQSRSLNGNEKKNSSARILTSA